MRVQYWLGGEPLPTNPRVHGAADGYNRPIVFIKLVWTDVNEFRTWMCLICGWIYDEAAGLPEEGIAPGTRWEDVPMNWVCPECGARKEDFEMVQV